MCKLKVRKNLDSIIDKVCFFDSLLLMRIFCLFLLIFIWGCQSIPTTYKKSSFLTPSPQSRFKDLSVPENFVYLPSKSFIFEHGKTRVGILKYTGKSNPEALINFLKTHMQKQGWKLKNIIEGGTSFLSFEKEKEVCLINIDFIGRKILLTFSIFPQEEKKPLTQSHKSE